MPKFPSFGRRKSTANALEDMQNAGSPAESSFKVLERPTHNKNNPSFDGGIKLKRPVTSPMQRGDNMFASMNRDRDSGGSNSNTTTSTFTTDNSSRLSAASTTPSTHNSGEYHRQDERVSHPDRSYDISTQKLPRAASAFSLKAGGRTFSFGRGKGTPPPLREEILPPPPAIDYESMGAGRSRGATTNSHAGTPPKLEERELGLNLGGDFSSDMFTDFQRKSIIQPKEAVNMPRSTDRDMASELAKPLPAYSNNRANHPPPLTIDRSRKIEPSPYSWTSHDSGRGLMTATPSPPPVAHMVAPPPVPPHAMLHQTGDNFASHARPQRPGGPIDSGLRRTSAFSGKRRSTVELADTIDEDAKMLRESYHASRQHNDSYGSSKENERRADPADETPKKQMRRAPSVSSGHESDDMFDPSIAEHAILANQLSEQALSPPPQRVMPRNKIMTPAQFERAKQDHERAIISGAASSSKDDDDDDNYDEDEDEAERLKEIAKQRKLQDAHMTVFRQGMMKSTGETPPPLTLRPNIMSSYSTPNLTLGGKTIDDDSDEDEEVPLSILAAHGFPNKNRHPSQLPNMSSNPNIRPGSQAGAYPAPSSNNGSAMGGGAGGNLPVFARHLPQDPYFGASVVNPLNRDPLAYGSGAGSSRGGGVHGQGLVGVIANEERNRAMRRGSPNTGMHQTPFGGTGGMNMHPNPQMHSNPQMQQQHMMQPPMMNPMGPMAMGPMGPMMMNPMNPMMGPQMMPPMGMSADQMDFMRMQMQMMQMQMMQGGGLPSPGLANGQQRTSTMTGTGAPTLQIPGIGPTPQRPQSSGRAMSLIDPNAAPWRNTMPQYTPSIAPSERSNVGLPGRYRPVSNAANGSENVNSNNSRAPSLSGMARWSNGTNSNTAKGPSSLATATTIKPSVKAVEKEEQEEDEEAGWMAMKAKREKKKGFWKDKKADKEIQGMLGHFQ